MIYEDLLIIFELFKYLSINRKEVFFLDIVYIDIRNWNFWYGEYGLCNKSCNDEVTIYLDKEQNIELGYFGITTKPSLEYLLKNEIDKVEDKEFYNEIESFLKSKDDIHYTYIYPRDDEDILRQVEHFAPTNEKEHKPTYIEMWTKLSDYWDINEIKKCVKVLVKEFLHEDVSNVEILGIPTFEETKKSYEEDYALYVK
jgi:hypothetical protein